MDARPVGMLDSGLGGISVLKEAIRCLPEENFVYFGDTAHIPYGDKPPREVLRLTREGVNRLLKEGCKAIVIACNTATSAAAEALRSEFTFPIIGVEPALKPASLLEGTGKIAVLATRVTLALPKFARLMEQYGQDAIPVPCPGLMECVERGEREGPEVDRLLKACLAPLEGIPLKAAVLGCTHYPFLRKAISAHLGEGVPLIDGSLGTARQLRRRLEEEELLSPGPGGGVRFLSSSPEETVLAKMQEMLNLE